MYAAAPRITLDLIGNVGGLQAGSARVAALGHARRDHAIAGCRDRAPCHRSNWAEEYEPPAVEPVHAGH
jgi:hypothetical protein